MSIGNLPSDSHHEEQHPHHDDGGRWMQVTDDEADGISAFRFIRWIDSANLSETIWSMLSSGIQFRDIVDQLDVDDGTAAYMIDMGTMSLSDHSRAIVHLGIVNSIPRDRDLTLHRIAATLYP